MAKGSTPSVLYPMSTKTESAETAITVPSICVLPPSPLRAWLCSYSEKIVPKDSPLSEAASNSGLSGCGLGMGTQAYEQLILVRITLSALSLRKADDLAE